MSEMMRVGKRQAAVIERARRSAYGAVMPSGFLERRALRRLTVRGVMRPMIGFPDVWGLTSLGLRVVLVKR